MTFEASILIEPLLMLFPEYSLWLVRMASLLSSPINDKDLLINSPCAGRLYVPFLTNIVSPALALPIAS